MKTAIGLYTQLTSTPASIFDRALALVYEPVLSFMYNNPGHYLALYQSSAMMKHIQRERPEYKSLITTLCKRGEIEPISGAYSQALLSLLPPKDRVSQIERLTSFIRHEYGVLPTTAFFYGQVWQPTYISPLKNAGIDNVVISAYLPQEDVSKASAPFIMNELGRKERIFPFDDVATQLVADYSQGHINGDELKTKLLKLLKKKSSTDEVLFLNVDQLVLGAMKTNDIHRPGDLIVELLQNAELSSIRDMDVHTPGYLSAGWYGRDAHTYGFSAFNDILVKNENFRYLYNRYISLAEGTQTRNNRFLKKDVTTALFCVSTGPLFIHDAQMAPLRDKTRQAFWSALIEAENRYREYTDGPAYREFDLEDIGRPDIVMANNTYTAVISPKGAASPEFDFMPQGCNLFDTKVPFVENIPDATLKKSFSDVITLGNDVYRTDDEFFSVEILDKKRTEVQYVLNDQKVPFTLVKRFKLRTSTFILDVVVSNNTKEKLSGTYSNEVYLNAWDSKLVGSEQRMDMVTNRVVTAKTVKYESKSQPDFQTIFSSTMQFLLTEEEQRQTVLTTAGYEEFGLWKKIVFSFPLEVEVGESVTYRIVMRANSTKKE